MKTVFAVSIASLFLCPALHSQSATTPNGGPSNSLFNLKFDAGAIVSLKPAQSSSDTQFISPGRRLGDVIIRYRDATNDWQSVNTAALDGTRTLSSDPDAGGQGATYRITSGSSTALVVQTGFTLQQGAVLWTITLQNAGNHPLEIGDLALPLPVSRSSAPTNGTVILKHSFISGHGSFLFWMRSDSAPPFLTLVPTGDTQLEYWENAGGRGRGGRGYLSAWALVNSGTPESNYGYWYPGKANDGAAGGGFEPSANGRMWLVPSMTLGRGSWFFASEIELGYCGALRTAATILADDPIFGRFCFGGDWRSPRGVMGAVPQGERFGPTPRGKKGGEIEIVPKDGLRRRFHALLNKGRIGFILDNDRFPSGQPIVLKEDVSEMRFQLESDNPAPHVVQIHFSAPAGTYTVRDRQKVIAEAQLMGNGNELILGLPMNGGIKPTAFTITRRTPSHSQE